MITFYILSDENKIGIQNQKANRQLAKKSLLFLHIVLWYTSLMNTKIYKEPTKFSSRLDILLYILSSEYDITARDVADFIQVSEKNLSKWRNGATKPKYNDTRGLLNFILLLSQIFSANGNDELPHLLNSLENLCYERLVDLNPQKIIQEAKIQDMQEFLNEFSDSTLLPVGNAPFFENEKIQSFYSDLVNACNLDVAIGSNTFHVPEYQDFTRTIAVKYRDRFINNFNNFILVLDILVNTPIENYSDYDFIPQYSPINLEKLKLNARKFINYIPPRNKTNKTSIASWFAQNIDIDAVQISNWKRGKDFPTLSHLYKLNRLLKFEGERGLLKYNMSKQMCFYHLIRQFEESEVDGRDN